MVSKFLALDLFIDIVYLAIIGLELYFYIIFDEDNIDSFFFFYIAEGVVISKILGILIYIIGVLITKSTYVNIGKIYCFIISIVNALICDAAIVKNSSWQLFLLPFGGMFVIFGSFYAMSKHDEEKNFWEQAPANQQQPLVPYPNDIEKLYPSIEETQNNYYMQKPFIVPINQNPVMNLYPSAEETQKEENDNMPPPTINNI